ncbi:3D domain-containing protein [Bdellovibrio sp. SKB1291214]|uniref:3D domain-containing protein n=1 Tax=Bdellovibrio sp. SKB1291214 TaxID=1732569 RepID=UPI0015956FF6|nr:3D domain-containing protein [Bdellovibrio sp. SKB1291214]UYL09386.1 3D domain-containing protein [Bdellovibrio sp. SKB1291214]
MKSIFIIFLASISGSYTLGACPGNIATTTLYNMDGLRRQGCKTGKGAGGECIIPYISIAADPDHNRMGTIIYMPSMRGKMVKLPNGQKKAHPGYFIIDDTGGAVQGTNKFDFFVGDPKVDKSSFSNDHLPDVQLVGPEKCLDTKKFKKIAKYTNRKTKTLNPKYKEAVRQMEDFWKAAKIKREDLQEVIEPSSAESSSGTSGGVN